MKIGIEVTVYDRFRFAIPLKGKITNFSFVNDGVEVKLLESNNPHYPIGCKIWVSIKQIRRRIQND